jgi:hypothetical protein
MSRLFERTSTFMRAVAYASVLTNPKPHPW